MLDPEGGGTVGENERGDGNEPEKVAAQWPF